MAKVVKLPFDGNRQVVHLPKEFSFKCDRVRIRKRGEAVVLEPVVIDVKEWLDDLLRHPLSKDFSVR
jgi:virulence-associated protein VagC